MFRVIGPSSGELDKQLTFADLESAINQAIFRSEQEPTTWFTVMDDEENIILGGNSAILRRLHEIFKQF